MKTNPNNKPSKLTLPSTPAPITTIGGAYGTLVTKGDSGMKKKTKKGGKY